MFFVDIKTNSTYEKPELDDIMKDFKSIKYISMNGTLFIDFKINNSAHCWEEGGSPQRKILLKIRYGLMTNNIRIFFNNA